MVRLSLLKIGVNVSLLTQSQKQNEGHYTLINFKSSPEFTAELDRIYNITDGVLRSLIVKKEVKPAKAKKAPKQFEAAKAE